MPLLYVVVYCVADNNLVVSVNRTHSHRSGKRKKMNDNSSRVYVHTLGRFSMDGVIHLTWIDATVIMMMAIVVMSIRNYRPVCIYTF